jgi:uncharacterized repeat protein (TIGR02543 family)
MRPLSLFFIALLAAIAGLFLFSCTTPSNPYDPSNTKIYLTIKSPTGLANADSLTDTVGNMISVGITANFPDYVDSIGITVYSSPDGNIDMDTVLKRLIPLKNKDTLWYKFTFATSGRKTLTATVFAGNFNNSTYGYLTIFDEPAKPVLRAWPHLVVNKTINITPSQTCSLAVSALDSNAAQAHTFYAKQDTLPMTAFTPPFKWTPLSGFIGTSVVLFKVTDTDSPAYFDTGTVTITVSATPINHAPHWQNKTLNEETSPGNAINLTLSTMCKDSDNDPLTFTLLDGAPSNDSIASAATAPTYTFLPGPGDTGTFYPKIVVTDSKDGYDTLTITLNIHAQSVTAIDSLPPVMALLSPARDSASVSSSALTIRISCVDNSGVASVKCLFGADSFPIAKADSNRYSANIIGLKPGVFNSISFIAADSSSRANKATLTVHVKYDSTVADNVPPIITLVSPSKDTVIGSDSCVVRVKSTDASGIQSVVYKVGTQAFPATKSIPTDSIYIATVKGLAGGSNSTITITVTDASPAHNAATATVGIKYDNDKTAPALRLLSPVKDSTSVSGNATTIQVVCTDVSGIASMTCNAGTTSYPITKSTTADSIWSSNITGLAKGQFTTLSIVATDNSLAANKATLLVHIKYDSTITDATGPVITKVSGLANNSRTANANDTLVYTVIDPSGVDTVSWTLNGTPLGVLTADANGQYSIKTLLTVSHTNKIVLIAYDKSTNHNKSTDTTIVNFNRSPVISGAHDTTIQELSTIQFTVTATDPDGDNKTLSAPTIPAGATFNTTTGAFSWSPTLTQTGANAVIFKANDGLDTTTKTISIVVSNMPPPVIATSTGDQTKCIGSPASFSVTLSGTQTVTYQWKNDAGNLTEGHYAGTKTAALTINSVVAGDANTYSCVVTNAAGSIATSTGAKLTVNALSSTPVLAANVASVCPPGSVTFTITGTLGTGANWTVYAGSTKLSTQPTIASNSFTISSINAATSYSVKAEGGSCDNASSPPTSNSVSVALTSFNVPFNANGGSPVPSVQPIICNSTATAPTQSPTKTGYDFVGWYIDTSSSSAFNFSTPITAQIILNAKWAIKTYQLTVVAGTGGTVTTPNSSPVTVYYGTASSIVAVASNGYAFVNWTVTTETATITSATSLSTTVTLSSGNATVTANFTPIYQVMYNGNGSQIGSVPSDTNHYKAGANVSVLSGSNGLIRNGYVFVGWKGGPADTNTKTFTMPSNNVTLNAQWDVRDTDGNHYDTVVINGVTWMVQNLKTTRYNNGTSIPHMNGSTDWSTLSTPAYCWYNDSIKNKNNYGALYNFYAVNTGNIAPKGWHVPTDGDFDALMNFLLITPAYINNFAPYFGGTVSSGIFGDKDLSGYWWSSTFIDLSASIFLIRNYSGQVATNSDVLTDGLSVRCIRGDPPK